jgi:hypothetical protein
MKKVRYLAGAVGAAPVLGLMMPPGNAEAAVTHAPAGQGKMVSLAHLGAARPYNFGGCNLPEVHVSSTRSSGLGGQMNGELNHSCISHVSGILTGGHTELLMRTRFYNRGGGKIGNDHFDQPNRHSKSGLVWTSWVHTNTVDAFEVCIALVENSVSRTRKYGDVCLKTNGTRG